MGKWIGYLFNMRYIGLLPYVGYLAEARAMMKTFWGNPSILAEQLAEVLFSAVNQYTKGLASKQVNRTRLTTAVRGVVDVFVDIFDGENGSQAQKPVAGV